LSSHSKMFNNAKIQDLRKKVVIEVDKFYENALPNEDIGRVIKKLLQQYSIDSLPSIIHTVNYKAAIPSDLDYIMCFKLLYSYVAENKTARHPAYYLESVLEVSDVVYADKGITYQSKGEKVTVNSKMGMLADTPMAYYAGASSTILNYYTRETGGSVEKTFNTEALSKVTKIPTADLTSIRSGIKTHDSSVTLSRESHYEAMIMDQSNALILIDKLYSNVVLKEFSLFSKPIQSAIDKYCKEKKINYVAKGGIPAVIYMKIDISEAIAIHYIWIIATISKSQIGGENAGMGGLTAGYYAYDMTPTIAKSLSRAREIMAILDLLSLKVVKLPTTKEFKFLCQQILVANGYTVLSSYGTGVCKSDSPPGLYQNSIVTHLSIISNTVQEPSYTKMGIKYDSKAAKKSLEGMFEVSRKNKIASLTYLVQDVKDLEDKGEGYTLFPCLMPHTGKVWVIKDDVGDGNKRFDKLALRFINAVYHRNLFPITRRPFFTLDPWNNFFAPRVIIPKIVRSEKKEVVNLAEMVKFTIVDREASVVFEDNYEIEVEHEVPVDPKEVQKRTIGKLLAEADLQAACDIILDIMGSDAKGYADYMKESIANSGSAVAQKALALILSKMDDVSDDKVVIEKKIDKSENADAGLDDDLLAVLGSAATVGVRK